MTSTLTIPTSVSYDYETMTISLNVERGGYIVSIEDIEMVPDLTAARLELEQLGYFVGPWTFGGIVFHAELAALQGCSCGMADYGTPGHDGDPAVAGPWS